MSREAPWVIISDHAFGRMRERFPALKFAPVTRLRRILIAIAFKGQPFGESCVDGQGYRLGTAPPGKPLVIATRPDRDDPRKLVITTVMTEDEARNAGPYRPGDDDDI